MGGMGTKPTGGGVPVSEAEGYTHAPQPMESLRAEDELETFLCGANVGEVLPYLVEELTRKTVVLGGKPTCPRCLVRVMSLREAQVELSNRLYEAAQLVELLEYAGKVRGHGHHMRQQLCKAAEDLLAERWVEE
jgi:hypothetical protein